jgi:prepilin-type N-terminal cleavage/methylation domain-containing protein
MTSNKKLDKGFSLIEVMIVIVIGLIIAALAIPNLLSARRAANEGSAISALRTLHGAQLTYQASFGAGNYAGTDSPNGDTVGLNQLRTLNLIDPVLGGGTKSGFRIVGAVTLAGGSTPATYFFSANPASTSGVTASGTRRFAVTQIGVIAAEYSNLGVEYDATTAPTAPPLIN